MWLCGAARRGTIAVWAGFGGIVAVSSPLTMGLPDVRISDYSVRDCQLLSSTSSRREAGSYRHSRRLERSVGASGGGCAVPTPARGRRVPGPAGLADSCFSGDLPFQDDGVVDFDVDPRRGASGHAVQRPPC